MYAALEARGLSKSFGSQSALTDVDLIIQPAEIHALLGQNGSGKSTLVKILSGYHTADSGASISLHGEAMHLPISHKKLKEHRVAFVHQDLALAENLSVWENLFIDRFDNRATFVLNERTYRRRARRLLERFGLAIDPQQPVSQLSDIERAELAIVRAFGDDEAPLSSGLIVLDEPTVYLPAGEVDRLFDLLRRVTDNGTAIIYVSHKLSEVLKIANRVTVLRDGRVAGTASTDGLGEDALIEMILGRSVDRTRPRQRSVERGEDAHHFAVEGLSTARCTDVSLTLGPGEVVGVTGLVGAGHEDLPYALFGAIAAQGSLTLADGQVVDLASNFPQRAVRNGIALVPANRLRDAVAAKLTVAENFAILNLPRFQRRAKLNLDALQAWVQSALVTADVRPGDPLLPLSALSGGNQQKVVLGRWIESTPRLLLLHEPTQGIDVGAKQEVYQALRRATASGTAVLLVSSEYDELASQCVRVVVFGHGRIADVLSGHDLTGDEIEAACLRAADDVGGAQ
jgi:ribose transport system ATP-binding protein